MHAWLVTAHEPAFKCHVKFIVHGSVCIFPPGHPLVRIIVFSKYCICYIEILPLTRSPINWKKLKNTEFYRDLLTIYYEQMLFNKLCFFLFWSRNFILFFNFILTYNVYNILCIDIFFSMHIIENSKYLIKFHN